MSGQIVDATIVAAPKQRNTEPETDALKAGRVPSDWKDKPAKLSQMDRDARWTMKRGAWRTGARKAPRSWCPRLVTTNTFPPTGAIA